MFDPLAGNLSGDQGIIKAWTRAGLFRSRAEGAAPAILVVIPLFLVPFAFVGYEFARIRVLYGSGFATALANTEIVGRLTENRKLAGVLFLLTGS